MFDKLITPNIHKHTQTHTHGITLPSHVVTQQFTISRKRLIQYNIYLEHFLH